MSLLASCSTEERRFLLFVVGLLLALGIGAPILHGRLSLNLHLAALGSGLMFVGGWIITLSNQYPSAIQRYVFLACMIPSASMALYSMSQTIKQMDLGEWSSLAWTYAIFMPIAAYLCISAVAIAFMKVGWKLVLPTVAAEIALGYLLLLIGNSAVAIVSAMMLGWGLWYLWLRLH